MTMKMFRSVLVFSVVAALAVSVASAQPAAKPSLKSPASLKEQAPAVFKASFETSAGAFVIEVHRDWAPKGADRFYNLVKNGFFDNVRFFRVLSGFMAQFGINGDPAVQAAWRDARITDCLLYTSDAADDLLCVDLGGRRIIKKKKKKTINLTYQQKR